MVEQIKVKQTNGLQEERNIQEYGSTQLETGWGAFLYKGDKSPVGGGEGVHAHKTTHTHTHTHTLKMPSFSEFHFI